MAFLAVNAGAASAKKPSKPKPAVVVHKVTCATKTSIVLAQGQTSVLPPVASGKDYGPATCGSLGGGIEADSFNVPDSGDTLAKYTMYFHTGTIHGSYDLTPQPTDSMNFLETDWAGTLKVLGGTGAYKGDTGTGTMVCKTVDGITVTCTDKLKLKGA